MSKIFDQNSGLTSKFRRKWFYIKVIMACVLESVGDFYEGRISVSVGYSNSFGNSKRADHGMEPQCKR